MPSITASIRCIILTLCRKPESFSFIWPGTVITERIYSTRTITPIREEVWQLYEHAVRRFGPTSTLIEWDDNIPEFGALIQIADEARDRAAAALRMAGNPGYDARAHAGLVQTADCRP